MFEIQRAALLPLLLLAATAPTAPLAAQEPLRVHIRAGEKTHGPGQHDHPRFLVEWSELLSQRGARVTGGLEFPTAPELEDCDVLVTYAAEGASIHGEERERFEAFLARGGGLVVVHDAVCGDDPAWFTTRAGGAWKHGRSKWLEGKVGLYFEGEHPITRGIPHFDLEDEIYHDLHLDEGAQVLASSFHDVFTIAPQMWTFEAGAGRVFVTLQGHEFTSFAHPAFRTILLRAIAWAGGREADSFTRPQELERLAYPPGGPTAPEKALASFELHPDFELELIAAEPLVVNPISIDWDGEGRPWVALTPGYPDKEASSGVAARDSIVILEDEDGDGRLDRAKTFADGLDLVTSFVFHGDGVIATQAPDILWLRDRDGDDVCDERVVLFTGFGYGDTHAVTSNLRWGPDGWIYGTQGYSGNASRSITSPHHDFEATNFGAIPNGVFRFRPDGSAIEAYSVFGSNTWGLDFGPDGELFFTMANGSHLRHVLLSEAELGPERYEGTRTWRDVVDHREVARISVAERAPYVQIDFVGGFTAASGCTIYSSGRWPEEFEGNHFVCEPTVNLVHRDLLRREGESFVASRARPEEFLASTDLWFRPVQARVAPDGSLWVLDFYNQAAVHNDTRGPEHGPTNAARRPDRDHGHGRIWRVQHREALDAPRAGLPLAQGLVELRRELDGGGSPAELPGFDSPHAGERILALWALYHRGEASDGSLRLALGDPDPGVRRNAARIAGLLAGANDTQNLWFPLTLRLHEKDERVRLAALSALRSFELGPDQVADLVSRLHGLRGDMERSLLIELARREPRLYLESALQLRMGASPSDCEPIDDFVLHLLPMVGHGVAGDWAQALQTLAAGGEDIEDALPGYLAALCDALPADAEFGWARPVAVEALAVLLELHASRPAIVRALLPLAALLGPEPELAPAIETASSDLRARVTDPEVTVDERVELLETLLALPSEREAALETAAIFLHPYFDPATLARVIDAVADTGDPAAGPVLAAGFVELPQDSRERLFQHLVTRAAWAGALLDRLEAGELSPADLGPGRRFQLREHPDAAVAARARTLLDASKEPAPEMDALLAELLPVVVSPGDRENGRELFIQNCAVCHRADGLPEGVGQDVGPSLVGMGAHGAEQLLPFVVDPNRSVEAAYLEYVCETTDGELVAGVLTYDGPASITLAGSAGARTVRRDEIETLRSTGRSPMPTGFEELGAEGLRDLLAFLCEGYEGFRVLDLRPVVCASTSAGLYDRRHDAKPMRFRRRGLVEVEGVPLQLIDPGPQAGGNDALVLRGGARAEWQSKTDMPLAVELPVGFALQRVHVLGGISAWGHPYFGEGEAVVRWSFRYADGEVEEHLLHDGVEFADWISRHDVPGSRFVDGLLEDGSWGQLRSFAVECGRPEAVVEAIRLESFDGRTAPTFLALTAELPGGAPAAPPRALILGGGASHDWARCFDDSLRATIGGSQALTPAEVAYTSDPSRFAAQLPELELAVLCNNQPLESPGLREALFAHVDSGRGLLLMHAATWYNWPDWPEFNRELVGGGTRGHEAYGDFDVELTRPDHAALADVPASFAITDELYRFERDPEGAPIEVLATGTSRTSGETYPVLWSVEREGCRILCTTLGHDGAAHESPAFQALVRGASSWLLERD